MTAEKPTYATAYNAAQARLKARVCSLLRWTETEFAEYQYRTGLAYLYWYLPTNDQARSALERSRIYWNWFKCMWNAYDMSFTDAERIDEIPLTLLRELYENLHCPRALAYDVKPNAVVLGEIKTNCYDLHLKG